MLIKFANKKDWMMIKILIVVVGKFFCGGLLNRLRSHSMACGGCEGACKLRREEDTETRKRKLGRKGNNGSSFA